MFGVTVSVAGGAPTPVRAALTVVKPVPPMFTVALRGPAAEGRNCTLMLQEEPGPSCRNLPAQPEFASTRKSPLAPVTETTGSTSVLFELLVAMMLIVGPVVLIVRMP